MSFDPLRCGCCRQTADRYLPRLERMSRADLVSAAREIVRGDVMVVDLDDRDWQLSLALLISGVREWPRNIGLMLVPVGPHQSGRWLNGRVPGVTTQLMLVPAENLEELRAETRRMFEALNPEEELCT